LDAGCESVLVFEDDAVMEPRFGEQWADFAEVLPADWDQIYLGGQYLTANGKPPPVSVVHGRLVQCRNVNRTHAYAIHGSMMEVAERVLSRPPSQEENPHIDHRLGKFHESNNWKVYAPWRFIVGQIGHRSDVIEGPGNYVHTNWWNEYPIEDAV
jgi:hypothetical protein